MFILIYGDPKSIKIGSGKTTLLTAIGLMDSRPVYVNYEADFGERTRKATPAALLKVKEPSLVLLDEAWAWVNARMSGTKVNIFLSDLVLQARKRQYDVVATVQLTRTLDVIFRDMIDIEIVAKKLEGGFGYRVIDPYTRKRLASFAISLDDAKEIFEHFNTWKQVEKLYSQLSPDVELDNDEMNQLIDEMCNKLRKENINIHQKTEANSRIRNWLLHNNYPTKYYTNVYDRLVSET